MDTLEQLLPERSAVEVRVVGKRKRYRVFIYTPEARLRAHFWLDTLANLEKRIAEEMSKPDPVTEAWTVRATLPPGTPPGASPYEMVQAVNLEPEGAAFSGTGIDDELARCPHGRLFTEPCWVCNELNGIQGNPKYR